MDENSGYNGARRGYGAASQPATGGEQSRPWTVPPQPADAWAPQTGTAPAQPPSRSAPILPEAAAPLPVPGDTRLQHEHAASRHEARGHGALSSPVLPPDPGRPRSRRRLALAGGIGAAGIIALAAVLLISQAGLLRRNPARSGAPGGFQPTGTSPAGDAQQTAHAFLDAWQSGNLQQAADYTDDPARRSPY